MEVDQNFIQDDKKWDRPWTTEEIRKNSTNWTLAGDVGLFNLLTEFSQNIISRTHEVENAVDSLVHRTKMAGSKINNVINDFHMLSNLQFVENRVYDEEVQETKPETKPPEKTKEQKEAEMLPKIIKAVELGLSVLDQAFNKISVSELSDSDDEELSSEGRMILEPKDPYESRPLPFIIGSDEFQNSDYAGLQDLLDEDVDVSAEVESSISDSDETSTDEEEPLPLDKGKVTEWNHQQAPSESDKYSSSEESELFGLGKEENGSISGSSFDSRVKGDKSIQPVNEDARSIGKESRTSSVSAKQSKPSMVQVLPVEKKPSKKKESSDLFANDDDVSDDDSPFRKKTGLFTSDIRFDDDKDMFAGGDLFGETTKEVKKEVRTSKPQPARKSSVETVVKKKNEPDLFGNEEDSDDDIFSTIAKTKAPSISKETKSFMKIGQALPGLTSTKSKDSISESNKEKTSPQDISEKTDTASTPSSALSIKSSGNAFDFTTGESGADNLFRDESDADDLFSSKKPLKKFDFSTEPDDEDDLFGLINSATSKKPQVSLDKKPDSGKSSSLFEESTEVDNKPSLFEESTEVKKSYTKMGTPLPGLTSTKPKDALFEEKKPEKLHQKIGQPLPGLTSKKPKDALFDDSDSSEQEDKFPVSSVKPIPPAEKKKEISLFDDDVDDDIFSQVPKKLMSPGESPSLINKSEKSQFDKLQSEEKNKPPIKSEKKSNSTSLFSDDDDFEKDFISKPSALGKQKPKESSLFEDSDNFDLFSPKTEAKKAVTKPSLQIEKGTPENRVPDETDGISSSKPVKVENNIPTVESLSNSTKSPKTEEKLPSTQTSSDLSSGIDLDIPPDTTSTLLVMNKDRAKIAAKRRKPTKKGRQAALASNDSENPALDTASPPVKEDSLFSEAAKEPSSNEEPPSITHKSQEKKKMNLMSQLMNEAAAKNFGKKTSPQPKEEEDEVDIFAEVGNKDRTKSRGFSFHSPIESAVPPPDKENGTKEATSVWDEDDDDNEDFFSEPSFKNFRSSFSHKDSVLNLDDDDDDLFSSAKTNVLPKSKLESSDTDIFADESDIFADVQKEKYEMFPSHVYDNEDDDDIFSSTQPASSSASKASNATLVKKAEKKPVNVFEDPLTGLLGDS
ncbi:hypothetical protein JTE90_018033 [Oedothorax gibbosus]|uniref:Uncharacterized protein n=1 Tax=Oedothorax gibbosus TaxID=931172 RepID=A0AAV6V9W0_9ARAC|nr:hypothetical protein JTE90_018033 [Oedothorax gibbosus]